MNATLALFPEMGPSAYSNEDLFYQDALLDGTEAAVRRVIEASHKFTPILLIGAPLRLEEKLFKNLMLKRRQVETYTVLIREIGDKDRDEGDLAGNSQADRGHASELADFLKRTSDTRG